MQQDNQAALTIDLDKTALLMMHWQHDIVSPGYKHASTKPERIAEAHNTEHAQAVLKASREKGMLIAYVNAVHEPGYPEFPRVLTPMSRNIVDDEALVRGTVGAEVIDELKPLDNEVIIENFNPSAFIGTKLDVVLRNNGITTLVVSGMSTDWVVETTARDAACLGYFVYTLKDCCNSTSDEKHDWPMENILPRLGAVIDSEAYIAALQRQAR
jgi:nicotinamidase-related amidase